MSNNPCPCGSGLQYSECCEIYISGKESAPTAEKLMRSRYSAFVVHNADYIYGTHDPSTRSQVNLEEIKTWSEESEWLGLQILETSGGQVGDTQGLVEFMATYAVNGKKTQHREKSTFNYIDGQWYFTDGKVVQETFRRDGPKVGRNEPCPCGSGKKFKRCCG